MVKHLLICMCLIATCLAIVSGELPVHIRRILDKHDGELQELLIKWNKYPDLQGGINVTSKEWLPGYFIKYDIERAINATRLKSFLQQKKLDLIDVPQKYVYQVFDKEAASTTKNSIVIAEQIEGSEGIGYRLSSKQASQLETVKKEAHHKDLYARNYIITKNDKIYIIDTDSLAMSEEE